MYGKAYFKQDLHTVKLPVKWMSLESLKEGKFSEKSDVVCFPTHYIGASLSEPHILCSKSYNSVSCFSVYISFISQCTAVARRRIIITVKEKRTIHQIKPPPIITAVLNTFSFSAVVIWSDLLGDFHSRRQTLSRS